jgi:hypothetical protein
MLIQAVKCSINCIVALKGTLTRDFRPLFLTSNNFPWYTGLPYRIWLWIREDNQQSRLHSGVIVTIVTCTEVSMTQLWHAQRCHWHCCDRHIGVIDTAMQPTFFWIPSRIIQHTVFLKGNLTRLHTAQRSPWHRCDMHSRVIDTAVQYDTAVTLNLIFEWLWLPLKGRYWKNIHKHIVLHYTYNFHTQNMGVN